MTDSLKNYWLYPRHRRADTAMPNFKRLVLLYGEVGAHIAQAYDKCGIATDKDGVFHVHFRENQNVDDAALRLCKQLPALAELVLNGTSISDDGLSFLSNLERL